ncbi:MAG: MFS transporter [Ignavibacteria bacterium]|nr:MFS transporter [Ignavibacteria bacterium]
MKNRSALGIIFLTVFIDLLGFGIVIPLLPSFSVSELGMSDFMIGFTVGVFSLMQFLFSPVWGALSDRYGRKPILIMSLTGSAISFFLLALVFSGIIKSVLLLVLSRAFAGVFAANISAALAAISDVTKPEERTKGIGLISVAFSLGFVFGPAIGGVLSESFGYGFPVFVAAGLSLLDTMLCIFIFRESLPKEIQIRNRETKFKIRVLDLKLISDVIKDKTIGKFVIIFFVSVFAFSNIFGTMQLFAERKDGLNLNQAEIGYLFSFLGICGALVQLVFLKLFKKFFTEEMILIVGCLIAAAGLYFIGYSTTVVMLLTFLFVLSLGNGMGNTVSQSLLSQNVSPDRQGTILGINQSLGSFARFLGPTWGGFVYQYLGYKSPFITGGIVMVLITIYSYKVLRKVR